MPHPSFTRRLGRRGLPLVVVIEALLGIIALIFTKPPKHQVQFVPFTVPPFPMPPFIFLMPLAGFTTPQGLVKLLEHLLHLKLVVILPKLVAPQV